MTHTCWVVAIVLCQIRAGGLYCGVALLGDESASVVASMKARWMRTLALEQALAADDVSSEWTDVAKQFWWRHSIVYREMHTLVASNMLEEAAHYASRLFSGILHEKGILRP